MGCVDEKTKKKIKNKMLMNFIKETQDLNDIMIPLRFSRTVFLSGSNYQERGFEIAAINYPRMKIGSGYSAAIIKDFMNLLAESLMSKFNQKRVSVVDAKDVVMYEAETGEKDKLDEVIRRFQGHSHD